MLVSSINNYQNILRLFPNLDVVFNFIRHSIPFDMDDTKIDIKNGIYALIQTCQPKSREEQFLEKHEKYVDLQYIICGKERIGWKFFDDSFKILKKYDLKKDITFYSNLPDTYIDLKESKFAIFFPEDTHSPLCCDSAVKKCIVKIPIDYLYNT